MKSNKKMFIGLLALCLALVVAGLMFQVAIAQGGSQCDQDPQCELYNDVGDTGEVGWSWTATVPGDITNVRLVGGNEQLPGTCFDISVNGSTVTITRLVAEEGAGGPDGHGCRLISHIEVEWEQPEVTNDWGINGAPGCYTWSSTAWASNGGSYEFLTPFSGDWSGGDSFTVKVKFTWSSGNPREKVDSLTLSKPKDCEPDNWFDPTGFPTCQGWSIDTSVSEGGQVSCSPGNSGDWSGENSVEVSCTATWGSGQPSEVNWSTTLHKPEDCNGDEEAHGSFWIKACKGVGNQKIAFNLENAIGHITGPGLDVDVSDKDTLTGLKRGVYHWSWTAIEGYEGSGSGELEVRRCDDIVEQVTGAGDPPEANWTTIGVGLGMITLALGGGALTSFLRRRPTRTLYS